MSNKKYNSDQAVQIFNTRTYGNLRVTKAGVFQSDPESSEDREESQYLIEAGYRLNWSPQMELPPSTPRTLGEGQLLGAEFTAREFAAATIDGPGELIWESLLTPDGSLHIDQEKLKFTPTSIELLIHARAWQEQAFEKFGAVAQSFTPEPQPHAVCMKHTVGSLAEYQEHRSAFVTQAVRWLLCTENTEPNTEQTKETSTQERSSGFSAPIKTRRVRNDPLSEILRTAKEQAVNSNSWQSVWDALVELASLSVPPAPLIGIADGDIKYYGYSNDNAIQQVKFLSKGNFRNRWQRNSNF